MARECSFDIRFTPNRAEIENARDQAQKELAQRYDFRGTGSTLEYDESSMTFTLQTPDEMKLASFREILERRLSGRGIPPLALSAGKLEPAAGGTVRQTIKVQQGIPEDKIKPIVAAIKASGLKVHSQIQGAEIRVFGKAKDDLQAIMEMVRKRGFGCALEFGNYR